MVRNVLALVSIIIISSTLFYLWALSYVRYNKNFDDVMDLHCCTTHDGDFLIIVHVRESVGVGSVDAIITDIKGNELNYSKARDFYMRDPSFAQVNITFNDRDRDGRVSDADFFLLPSKENGGVAQIGGEFILKDDFSGDVFGRITLEGNHDYSSYSELKSSWNFMHVGENVTVDENQSASKAVVYPYGFKPEFQLLFQWPLNDTLIISVIVENATINNYPVKSSVNNETHFQWKHDYDPDYHFENDNDFYCYFKTKYTIRVSSINTGNTILTVNRDVEFEPIRGICLPSFQTNIFSLLLSMIFVGGFGYRETRKIK